MPTPLLSVWRSLPARLACLLIALTALCASVTAQAQRTRTSPDDQVVSRATLVASGKQIELYQDGATVDPAFLAVLEETYTRIAGLLGRPHDKATLGDKLRVYVTDTRVVSHVWHGYEHQRDPRGILILNLTAYLAGTRGTNATYAHELTHLFTWRFYSHTLREGLADYIALQILPGAAIGPNTNGYDWNGSLPPEVLELLGTTVAAPAWATNDIRLRQAYYFGSYRFVQLLIDKGGLMKFMQLYASPEPETAYEALYAMPRAELVQAIR